MASRRLLRVSHSIRDVLGELLLTEVRDPRILAGGVVSITSVDVSADLSSAKVWVSVTAEAQEVREGVLEGFHQAAGFLRAELGRRLRLKRTPVLRFQIDDTEVRAWRVEALLREIGGEEGEESP